MLLLLVVLVRPLLHTSIKAWCCVARPTAAAAWLLAIPCCSIPIISSRSVFPQLLHAHHSRNLPHAVAVHHVRKLKLLAASPLLPTAPAVVRHSLLPINLLLPLLVASDAARRLCKHATDTITSCCCRLCCAIILGAAPSSNSRWGGCVLSGRPTARQQPPRRPEAPQQD